MGVTPVIYVIIPIYKAEKYIAQTLDSVLAQPYPNIRIVCVDDGSPDDSISIIREYKEKYDNIHMIHQENGGVSSARNTGIGYVLGRCTDRDYMAFLDADDLWARNVITPEQVSQNFDSDCVGFLEVLCSNNLLRVSKPLKREPNRLPGGQNSIWCDGEVTFGAIFYSCRMIRSYHIRFLEGLRYTEDKQFKYTCLYLADHIRLIDQVLYCYRANPAGVMHTRKFGIEFMMPLIHGYLRTDAFLKPYENEIRGKASFARLLAGALVLEMIEEHYQCFGSRKALAAALRAEPVIEKLLLEIDEAALTQRCRKLYDEYLHHNDALIWKCRVKGIVLLLRRVAQRNRLLCRFLDARRYSLPNIYLQ